MKTKVLVVALLITMLMIQDVESWRVRIRLRRVGRFIRRIWRPVCRWGCPRVCRYVNIGGRYNKYVCSFGCKYLCGKKKRSAIETGHITPLSTNFAFYDLNDNNFIDRDEFSATFGQDKEEGGLNQCWKLTDIDGDDLLSAEEFSGSTCFEFDEGDEAADSTPEPTTTEPTTQGVK